MNAHFTRKPTNHERWAAERISQRGKALVQEYANEVGDGCEYNNSANIENAKIALLAYIAELEDK